MDSTSTNISPQTLFSHTHSFFTDQFLSFLQHNLTLESNYQEPFTYFKMPIPIGPLLHPVRALVVDPHSSRDVLELTLTKSQPLKIIEVKSEYWFIARTQRGKEGWVPAKKLRLLGPLVNTRIFYDLWTFKTNIALGKKLAKDKEGKVILHRRITGKTFPFLPPEICGCDKMECVMRKEDTGLGACVHDVERLLKGAGEAYCAKWLWGMSLMWHPDQFARKCAKGWRDEGRVLANEMFVILSELIEKERAREEKRDEV